MPRRQNKEDTYHVQQSIMAAIFRLFSQNPAPGPDGNHPADNYFLFAGAGDRGGCGPRAVCKYSGTQADRPLLYLDFRGTPLLVQLFVVFFGLSRVGIVLDPFPAAVIVFSLNEGAYCAETIRAALESVPKGQLEAGLCAGLSYLQTIFRIVLPQAMRTAFPPLSNSLISMVKDTSLAANITVTEMFMVTQRIVARTYEPLLLYLEVGLIYLIFSTVLTKLQAVGEKKLGSYGQKGV